MPGSVIHLQNLVPIVAFLRWKVSSENQVCPSGLGSNAGHSQAEHIDQQAPRFIGVECRHDFGSLRQPDEGRLDQTWLLEIRFASQAGLAGLVLGIRAQRGMGPRINGAFGQDQTPVIRSNVRKPQALFAPSGKAGKSLVLDLVSTPARGVEMRKHGIATAVDPHPAGKSRRAKQGRRQSSLVLQIGMPQRVRHAPIGAFDPHPIWAGWSRWGNNGTVAAGRPIHGRRIWRTAPRLRFRRRCRKSRMAPLSLASLTEKKT